MEFLILGFLVGVYLMMKDYRFSSIFVLMWLLTVLLRIEDVLEGIKSTGLIRVPDRIIEKIQGRPFNREVRHGLL